MIPNLLIVSGCVAAFVGGWLIHPSVALIAGGLLVTYCGVRLGLVSDSKQTKTD